MQRNFAFVLIVPALIAVSLLAAGGWLARDSIQLRERGERVQGTVVDMQRRTDSDGDASWRPVYEYRHDGRQRRHESNIGSSRRPTIGSRETLLVDPQDPDHVRADTFMGLWFLPVLLGGIGLVFLLTVLLVLVPLFRRISRTRDPQQSTTSVAPDAPDGRSGPFL